MKDLYGIRKEDVDMLKQFGYISDETYVGEYGKSEIDGADLYWVAFDTSEEKNQAFNLLYNN